MSRCMIHISDSISHDPYTGEDICVVELRELDAWWIVHPESNTDHRGRSASLGENGLTN